MYGANRPECGESLATLVRACVCVCVHIVLGVLCCVLCYDVVRDGVL
jgi:hypothetical protein